MVTKYPGHGASYMRHIDNPNQNGRVLTTILYLNEGWTTGDGGELRIYPPQDDPGTIHAKEDIAPLFNRLVVFLCDKRVPHEVLPSNHDRYAVTIWYQDLRETLRAEAAGQDETQKQRAKERIREEISQLGGTNPTDTI
eukprot:TRINITY_DN3368_c0_g2_i1.p1 TRINITY_DN3368_c0_g2~~TRINITY_DN3368_c0_g2_i1.p1  ORF type:complete len:139 (+),score=18.43 TRINITY_DN3368_c0_g2_i1:152-568(+)